MNKEQIVEVLETIATLLELKDENPFKIRAYTNAARSIETWGGNLRELAEENRLEEIPGIGKAIAAKISALTLTGSSPFYDELRAEFPADILELFSLPGLGAKKIKALYEKLQVSSIATLAEACETGRVAELPGFGKATQEKLCQTIADRAKHAGSFTLGSVAADAEGLQNDLRLHPDALRVSIAGSYRRRKEIVRDLDFIVATKAPEAITEFFVRHPLVESVIARGATKTSVRLRSGIQADLRVVSDAEYPFALGYFTGSKEHNIVLRNRALQRGWTLKRVYLAPAPRRSFGAKKKTAARKFPLSATSGALSRARSRLHPAGAARKLRRNRSGGRRAFAAVGRAGKFARRVSLPHQRERRPQFARRNGGGGAGVGLQYLGIADHSQQRPSRQAWTRRDSPPRAARGDPRVEHETFDGFRLFAGVECDILRDGSLDFDDDTLGELDYVVASIHSAFN